MKNILNRQLILVPILYILAVLSWGIIPLHKLPDILSEALSTLFGPLLLMSAMYLILVHLLWKVPVLEKLVQLLFGTKPHIQGTWQGQLKYEWEGKKTEKTVFLVIKQADGYSINIRLITDERISSSTFADIMPYSGGLRIVYTYSNEESPANKERNPSHEGFCQLDLGDDSKTIQGIYYTSRKTFGEMIFDKRKRKAVMNYEQAKKLFGV
jgi:hypothetical protein